MLEPITKWMVALQIAAQSLVERAKGEGEEGQTLVEYALILVLIAIVVIVVLTLVGTRVNNIFNTVANTLQIR
jgi:pilus assembly protein Flp/PilA